MRRIAQRPVVAVHVFASGSSGMCYNLYLAKQKGIPTVTCKACDGTGAKELDCAVCEGNRHVGLAEAARHGFDPASLDDVDDDTCICPACDGETCLTCEGSGEVLAEVDAQQGMRVLVYAKGKHIPSVFYTDHMGQFRRDSDALLCKSAAAEAHERRDIFWLVSIFGDEISLAPSGRAPAREAWRAYRGLWKRWVAAERSRRATVPAGGSIA